MGFNANRVSFSGPLPEMSAVAARAQVLSGQLVTIRRLSAIEGAAEPAVVAQEGHVSEYPAQSTEHGLGLALGKPYVQNAAHYEAAFEVLPDSPINITVSADDSTVWISDETGYSTILLDLVVYVLCCLGGRPAYERTAPILPIDDATVLRETNRQIRAARYVFIIVIVMGFLFFLLPLVLVAGTVWFFVNLVFS